MNIAFGLALLALVIFDFINMRLYEAFTIVQDWITLVLILHVANLYISLLSFIYSSEAGDKSKFQLALGFMSTF